MTGAVDARFFAPELEDLLGVSDPDEVCALMAGFGESCDACSSDGEAYCIDFDVRDLSAESLATSLETVTAADIAANADCQ